LTGGRSTRFGSDKSQARLGKNSLIEELLATLPQDIEIIIVGPQLQNASRAARYTHEDPLGGGPVAAIHAGLDLVDTEFVAVIATDIPFANSILAELTKNFPISVDATIPLDKEGVRQTLCALYRVDSLRQAITNIGNPENQSMRALCDLLKVNELQLEPQLERNLIDIDTPSDLEQAITLGQELKG